MAKPPKVQTPVAPPHLSTSQAAIFIETAAKMEPPLTAIQRMLLEAYAIEFDRWQEAEKFVRENGLTMTVRNDKGEAKAVLEVPHLKIAQRARDAALDLANQLGLAH